jgi:hypothetical protein
MAKHIFILAGSHRQAADFAREKKLHPQNWTFLYKAEQLRGWSRANFIRCGTWGNLRDISDIEEMIINRQAKECTNVGIADT